MKNEINIKSSTIEKGLEIAKEFLNKLISPTVEEVGLLISDKIKFYRFKNQIDILLKAKKYVEQRKININIIPIKILMPFLENASLEDDDLIQDKWAKMLVNMVDSKHNLQNQIFPHLLSQISIEEFNELKLLFIKETEHLNNRRISEDILKQDKVKKEPSKAEIEVFFNNLEKKLTNENDNSENMRTAEKHEKEINDLVNLYKNIEATEQSGFWLNLKEFEIANLLRLGLIKQLPPKIYIREIFDEGNQLIAEYDNTDYGFRITELGIKFLNICELNS